MKYALDSNIISFLLKNNDTVYSRYYDAVSVTGLACKLFPRYLYDAYSCH